MSDPSLAVQKGVYDALSAHTALQSLLGDETPPRVYDDVPDKPTFPYVTIGDDQVIDDSVGCGSIKEVFVTVHAWTRGTRRRVQAKQITAEIEAALDAQITLGAGHQVVEWHHQDTRVVRDPDGLTAHGIVTVRYLTQPT